MEENDHYRVELGLLVCGLIMLSSLLYCNLIVYRKI